MIDYIVRYHNKLLTATWEHLQLVLVAMAASLIIAAGLTLLCSYSKPAARVVLGLFSMIYSIPSLAMFALLIPVTGLGFTTAVVTLTIYNQYLLLRNFLTGLNEVDKAIVESAAGMGMSTMQILVKIQLPLCKRALVAGIRIALVATVGIATIAASINAGGLGTILFDGLRTMNEAKILWGSLLSALLAIVMDGLLSFVEKRVAPGVPDPR